MHRIIVLIFLVVKSVSLYCQVIYVGPGGIDGNPGSKSAPLFSIEEAIARGKEYKLDNEGLLTIILLSGNHYLEHTIRIDDKLNNLIIKSEQDGTAIIKGSRIIVGPWKKYKDGIWKIKVKKKIGPYSQLFIDGKPQILARYPNYDENGGHYNGYAPDAISADRISRWKNPEGAILHVMHSGEWGGFHYVIDDVSKDNTPTLSGGHQNNRPSGMHEKYRMIENVFEELDSPGEWYFDNNKSILYVYPRDGVDLNGSKIEISDLNQLFIVKGDPLYPVKKVEFIGLQLVHTNRTFMDKYEPLLRSDWTIYRGGAIYFENTENCSITKCGFFELGGNAVFVSGYNRKLDIKNNHISNCGASGISFVGYPSAVRAPSFQYNEFVPYENMDTLKGPKNNLYPYDCVADNNLIHNTGLVEKQTAGVQLSMAMKINILHNSIYNVPRAGINICDGTWGGHIIEYNDVFNTVLHSSDHGAFNSWGRDRFWHPNRKTMDSLANKNPGMSLWDAQLTTIIRNNRMQCDHGWDIDLDDGSSNYEIYNNLCLSGGIKLREGFYRKVKNNIIVNNGFHPHVWFKNSGDIFTRNIVMTDHKDIRLQGWGTLIDYNHFSKENAFIKSKEKNTDTHSTYGDPEFVDPTNGDFRIKDHSPAVKIGFQNFSMDEFGVQNPELKRLAETPEIPSLIFFDNQETSATIDWLGAKIRNISSIEERSAVGLRKESGIIIQDIRQNSLASKSGLLISDVIIECEETKVHNIQELFNEYQGNNWKGRLILKIMRDQREISISINTK